MLPEGAARWAFGFGAACYAAGLRPPDHWGCARDDGDLIASWFDVAPGAVGPKRDLVVYVSYTVEDEVCALLSHRGADKCSDSFMVGRWYDRDTKEHGDGPSLAEALAHVKRFLETGLYRPETEAALAGKAPGVRS
ncbi:MAG: hypothetical protein MUF34_30715 [Polyangiaceae bacterium]|jgi:hypothetical protein|nr:hypothetical protein [Polyangiaceae bacterium]